MARSSSIIPFRPRQSGSEWLAGRYPYPRKLRDGRRWIKPDVVIWLELPEDYLLVADMVDPSDALSFQETFTKALHASIDGRERRMPATIRVPDETLAAEVRRVAGDAVEVVVAPVPELDAIFADMMEQSESNNNDSYVEEGLAPELMAEAFAAAANFYRARPWKVLSASKVLAVDIAEVDIRNGCLAVGSPAKDKTALRFFPHFDHLFPFGGRGPDWKERSRRWEVAGPAAYPALFAFNREMSAGPVHNEELRILTACMQALVDFLPRLSEGKRVTSRRRRGDLTLRLKGPITF